MTNRIILVHGVGCTGDVWTRMAKGFQEAGWQVDAPTLFPEQRVKADPPAALAQLTLADYVDQIAEQVETVTQADGQPPVIMGHSMGGLIAQMLAVRLPLRAAIFLTPAQPEGCTVTDLRVVRTFWNILKVGQKNIPGGSFKVGPNGFSYGVLNRVPRAQHAEIYADAVYDSGLVYRDLGNPPAIDEADITCPTLTIGAAKDRATVIKAVRKVAAKYAKAPTPGDYLEYKSNGHWIVDEPGTDQVVADILDWLANKGLS